MEDDVMACYEGVVIDRDDETGNEAYGNTSPCQLQSFVQQYDCISVQTVYHVPVTVGFDVFESHYFIYSSVNDTISSVPEFHLLYYFILWNICI